MKGGSTSLPIESIDIMELSEICEHSCNYVIIMEALEHWGYIIEMCESNRIITGSIRFVLQSDSNLII